MAQGKVKVSGKSKKPAHQQRKQAPIKGKADTFYKKKNINVSKVRKCPIDGCIGNQQKY
jgi:hypothetical protein